MKTRPRRRWPHALALVTVVMTLLVPAVPASAAAPTAPSQLAQSAGGDPLADEGVTNETLITLNASIADTDESDQVRLQVEVVDVLDDFADVMTDESDPSDPGVVSVDVQPGAGTWKWQARSIDAADETTGEWVDGYTFRINAAPDPAPSDLKQFESNGTTEIPPDGTTNDTTIVFEATVTDPDNPGAGDLLGIDVDVEPVDDAFGSVDGSTAAGDRVTSGTVRASVTGLSAGVTYHWRVRTFDQYGATSGWKTFADTFEVEQTFRIPQADLSVDHELPTSVMASSGATTRHLTYEIAVENDGPDPATNVTIDETFDATVVVTSTARWEPKVGTSCPAAPSNAFATGDTIGISAIAANATTTVCVRVEMKFSPTPLINGPISSDNTVAVSSPVFDPDLSDNSDTDSTNVFTTPSSAQNVTAFPGNDSAVVTWQAPANNGGSAITGYTITTIAIAPHVGGSVPAPVTVGATTFRYNFGNDIVPVLTNGQGYRFTVQAVNAVGTGPSGTSNDITPSFNDSAEIIDVANNNFRHTTGTVTTPNTCALPIGGTDDVTGCQEFKGGSNGVGNIRELSQSTPGLNGFCGGACFGSEVLQYELSGVVDGRATLTMTFSKQVAGSTGTKVTVYYDSDGLKDNQVDTVILKQCPKNGPATLAVACVVKVVRLGPANVGKNPDLQIVLSIPEADASDPLSGARK
jgi:hypothetical protein